MRLQDSKIYINDLDMAIDHSIGIEKLKNKSILITGATGTIGSYISDMILRYNQIHNGRINIYLAGRNIEKLKAKYEFWNDSYLDFVSYDITSEIKFEIKKLIILFMRRETLIHWHLMEIQLEPLSVILRELIIYWNMVRCIN